MKIIIITMCLLFKSLIVIADDSKEIISEEEYYIPEIKIEDAWIRKSTGNSSFLSLYLSIENLATETDYLVSVESNISQKAFIQKTVVIDNISKIINVKKVAIPPKTLITFKPGGIHVLLLGLNNKIKIGDQVEIKLFFEKTGLFETKAVIKQSLDKLN